MLKTNAALAQFNTTSKQLSQSQKAIARTILVTQSGSNAFGDMANSINTLQNQFRVMQGSWQNFKLAFGDLIQEPTRQAIVQLNGLLIAVTEIIRAFHPLQTTSKTGENQITQIGEEANEASEALDEMNGKLATFDKFNVLGGQSKNGENLSITEALTKELQKQQALYKERLEQVKDVANEAKQMAKNILGFFVKLDEKGNVIKDKNGIGQWTEQAKLLGATVKAIGVVIAINMTDKFIKAGKAIASFTLKIFTLKNGITLLNVALATGALYAFAKMVELFKEGDHWGALFAGTIGVALTGAWIAMNKQMLVTIGIKIGAFFKNLGVTIINFVKNLNHAKFALNATSAAVSALSLAVSYLATSSFLKSLSVETRQIVSPILTAASAISTLTLAILAYQGVITWGTALPMLAVSIGTGLASFKDMLDINNLNNIPGFADGGISTANLIMTHENGKREWVGRQGNANAVVNDTQMSDVMRSAVAQGTYEAFMAMSAKQNSGSGNQNITVMIDGREVFSATRKEARRQGLDFARR